MAHTPRQHFSKSEQHKEQAEKGRFSEQNSGKIDFQHEYRGGDFLHEFRGLSVQVCTAVRTVRTSVRSVQSVQPFSDCLLAEKTDKLLAGKISVLLKKKKNSL